MRRGFDPKGGVAGEHHPQPDENQAGGEVEGERGRTAHLVNPHTLTLLILGEGEPTHAGKEGLNGGKGY